MVEVVVVNQRIALTAEATESLRRLFTSASDATSAAEFALELVCQSLGIDRSKVVGFDSEAGALILEEPDPAAIDAIGA